MKSLVRISPWFLLLVFCFAIGRSALAQGQKRIVRVFLELRETNLEKPSTVATNTLAERLTAAGLRVTTKRSEAILVVEGTIASRTTPVTEEAKREGGVNAEATASLQLLVGTDVIASSVERTGPGDWGVQAERVGEDRLIEVAGRVADDLIASDVLGEGQTGAPAAPEQAGPKVGPGKPATAKKKPRKGVSFLEVASLVQNSAPEDRIVAVLRKYGIKFKPRDGALKELRGLGASESLISAIKGSSIVG